MLIYKSQGSIYRNWEKDQGDRPLFKTVNDILGLRFILKSTQDNLEDTVATFIKEKPEHIKVRVHKHLKNGYSGIHVYVRFDNHSLPIEIQFWTRTDALLNIYYRDTLYPDINDSKTLRYMVSLREWLSQIPFPLENLKVISYVDYLYKRGFQDKQGDDMNV